MPQTKPKAVCIKCRGPAFKLAGRTCKNHAQPLSVYYCTACQLEFCLRYCSRYAPVPTQATASSLSQATAVT